MKSLLAVVCLLLSFSSFAQKFEVEIVSAEFGVEDEQYNKSLCLTVVRIPESGELLGLVEGIHDCFYARAARRSPHNKLNVNFKDFAPLEYADLKSHLQRLDTQLKFYISEGE